MILPGLNTINKNVISVQDFLGYNHNLIIEDNEFYHTKNITMDHYPIMTQRDPRGTLRTITKPNGLYAKEVLYWVDGTDLYRDGEIIGQVEDSKKQFASMGAYLLIFPDKLIYNTNDGTLSPMENRTEFSGTVQLEMANLTESEQNTTEYAMFLKITAAGIGKGFKQFDGVEISGFPKSELNKTAILYEVADDYVLIIGEIEDPEEIECSITLERKTPEMEFFTESMNRLWGCSSKNHEIYACKLGDPTNWYAYEGISTDSYAVTIGSDGEFTGACTYLGYVLFFKENTIHKIMGNKPSNYEVMEQRGRGVEAGSEKSLVIVNETLYYKARTGIVAYQGASATSISDAFGTVKYKNAVAGVYGNKYYVSMDDGEAHSLFCYDETKGAWVREDDTHILYAVNLNNMLYYIDDKGVLKSIIGNDDEAISWEAASGDIFVSGKRKYVGRMDLRVNLEKESFLEIWISYDNSELWERVKTITALKGRAYDIPVRPRRCDHFRIKMKGVGKCNVYALEKTIEIGSVVNVDNK